MTQPAQPPVDPNAPTSPAPPATPPAATPPAATPPAATPASSPARRNAYDPTKDPAGKA